EHPRRPVLARQPLPRRRTRLQGRRRPHRPRRHTLAHHQPRHDVTQEPVMPPDTHLPPGPRVAQPELVNASRAAYARRHDIKLRLAHTPNTDLLALLTTYRRTNPD